MSLTVSSDTRSALTALYGSRALIDLSNPASKSATSVDWDVVGYGMENLIARFAEVGATYTQDDAVIRQHWWMGLWGFQRSPENRIELAALLARHRGASRVGATDGAAQGSDEDADRPWLFSETQIDDLIERGKPRGNRSPGGTL